MARWYPLCVYGCGNPLFGDDGAGYAVISLLKKRITSNLIFIENAGTSIREILFDYLINPAIRPKQIILVDAVKISGAYPGEILEIDPEKFSFTSQGDVSLHQCPTMNMLLDLKRHSDILIKFFGIQALEIPYDIRPGLSNPVKDSVIRLADKISNIVNGFLKNLKK